MSGILPNSMIELIELSKQNNSFESYIKMYDEMFNVVSNFPFNKIVVYKYPFLLETSNGNRYFINYFEFCSNRINTANWFLKLFGIKKYAYSVDFKPIESIEIDFYDYCEFKIKEKNFKA